MGPSTRGERGAQSRDLDGEGRGAVPPVGVGVGGGGEQHLADGSEGAAEEVCIRGGE